MKPILLRAAPVAFLALSPVARAADGSLSAAGSLLQMLFGLAVVLAALFGALRLLRRVQGSRPGLAGNLKVLSATAVGPRERVVLVSVADKVLVLGVAPGHINALHTLDAADLPAAPEAAAPTLPSADFAARLKQLLEGKRNAR
ncbi:MAG: flagellar biosynthetic protein FliO [Rhodocyclaceae bacterium]